VPTQARGRFPWAARALEQKLYFDDAYQAAFYEPSARTAVAVTQFVEEPLVLRSLRGLGDGVRVVGSRVGAAQTGLVRSYALALAGGLALLAVVFLVVSA
jgi:NADH:ubiquinone oxidoreductase subunit 5 (subunit L)/multisubunit Na+/H+ antiporter MnhA subunit